MKKIILYLILSMLIIFIGFDYNSLVSLADDEEWITLYFATREYLYGEEVDYTVIKIHPGETTEFPTPNQYGLSEERVFAGWKAYDLDINLIGKVDETTKFYQSAYVIPSYVPGGIPSNLGEDVKGYTVLLDFDDEQLYKRMVHYIEVEKDETDDLKELLRQSRLLDLEREGYIFLGWFTEKQGGKEIDDTVYVKSDMTIYAHWKLNDGVYKLEYSKNYNMLGNEDPYRSEWTSKVSELPKLKREGYEFVGWYYSANFYSPNYKVKKGDTLTHNTRIFAHWEKIQVKNTSVKKTRRVKVGKLKVTIKKLKTVDGYQIMCSKNKKFAKKASKIYNTKKNTKTIKLKKKMKYIKVRAYRVDSAGKKVYGKWSKVKKIKR